MNKAFERWVHQRYGNRYDLTRDVDGFYCREVVKRIEWLKCGATAVDENFMRLACRQSSIR